MAQIVPLYPARLAYGVRVNLGGVRVVVDAEWRPRAQAWYLGMYTVEREPLLVGMRAAIGSYLLQRSQDPRLPPGDLILIRQDGREDEPGRDELGDPTRVLLYYMTPEEVAAAQPSPPAPTAIEVS